MSQELHPKVSIAYFVSPHGFGHAARESAVINAIYEKWPYVHVDLFTTIPEWFFKDSLCADFCYREFAADIGTVQQSPLEVDLEATLALLDETFPLADRDLTAIAAKLEHLGSRLVISDISPWGIAAAQKAGIPSILIENFTWDWIYDAYVAQAPQLQAHIRYLEDIFNTVDLRIQAIPCCSHFSGACLETPPISRKPISCREDIRARLGLGETDKMVLITMGGIPETHRFISELSRFGKDMHFVVPGGYPELPPEGEKNGNVTRLPHRSAYYHPDLVNAADAVVGKVGYSTLAEVCQAGVPFGYVLRPNFRESAVLESFIRKEMSGLPISQSVFESGSWLSALPELLSLPEIPPVSANGADVAAEYICRFIACHHELLEVIDSRGEIRGAAPRCEVHGNNEWLHRVVHVLVFDSSNRLLLQKRSMAKTVAPGKWDTSVGGHVDCGESIESAMHREMAEEFGIETIRPEYAYQYIHSNDFESELVYTYVCQFDGEVRFNRDEIDVAAFWELPEIEANLGCGLFSDNFEHEYSVYRIWSGK